MRPEAHHSLLSAHLPLPRLPAASSSSDFFRGLFIPLHALALILRVPKLLLLSLLCAAVTSLALIGVGVASWSLGQQAASELVGAAEGWQHVASVGLGVVFFIVLFILGALSVPSALLSPLQDPLSETTEARCSAYVPAPFSLNAVLRGTLQSLLHTLLRLGLMVLGLLVLFPLNLIPGAGSVLWIALSSVWSAFWIAAEQLSNPMARHLRPFRHVVRALRARLSLALGFGTALYALLWLPVLNCFLMPVATVAGTVLYLLLQEAGALPES